MKARAKNRRRGWLRWALWMVLGLIVAGCGLIAAAYFSANWVARDRLFSDLKEMPAMQVALVFGTSDRFQGRENLYYRYRIDAAVALWESRKVQTIIVSGDNRSRYYNEPEKMKASLIERGVPSERIVCDYAGLRTLDSVVRAQKIFGAERLVFVSQKFQNERAIFIARAHGIDAYGFNAQDVDRSAGMKTRIREVGARVKMWLDLYWLETEPRHLGDQVPLPEIDSN